MRTLCSGIVHSSVGVVDHGNLFTAAGGWAVIKLPKQDIRLPSQGVDAAKALQDSPSQDELLHRGINKRRSSYLTEDMGIAVPEGRGPNHRYLIYA